MDQFSQLYDLPEQYASLDDILADERFRCPELACNITETCLCIHNSAMQGGRVLEVPVCD
ncbi:MAG: hypothetical protein SOZ59_02380 [Candidatus Limivivens sp.]|nr:hypothetical protein [Candidatus Limivivens sp.]